MLKDFLPTDFTDIRQCKYCLKEFDNDFAHQTHVDGSHNAVKAGKPGCRICEISYDKAPILISHMERVHGAAEMPYSCSICGFRSSVHKHVVDHFQEAHDRTDKLLCPRCLRVFALYTDKGYSSSMAVSYIQHLQTHVTKEAKCRKCTLKFHTEVMVRSHVDKDHMSYKNFDSKQ